MINNVPYTTFNEYFGETQKKQVSVVIEESPMQPALHEHVNTEKPIGNLLFLHIKELSW